MQLTFIFILLFREFSAQNYPCSYYWQYITGSDRSTQGLLTLYPKYYQQHNVRILLSVTSKPRGYVGDINLVKDTQSALNDAAYGRPIQYRVRFPYQYPLPELYKVYYNDELYCTQQLRHGIPNTIELFHVFPAVQSLQVQNFKKPVASSRIQQSSYRAPQQAVFNPQLSYRAQSNFAKSTPKRIQTTKRLRTTTRKKSVTVGSSRRVQSSGRLNSLKAQCGKPKYKLPAYTGLVIDGREATKGQFPWLASFYHNSYEYDGFVCGGSLVSQKIVVTAAHCIQDKQSTLRRKPEESFFHLRKFYLNPRNERDVIYSGVSQFIVHPSYNVLIPSYDGDIAIAVLQRSITFTQFIKPICIWTKTNTYSDLINRQGVVAGWGKTKRSITASNKPNWVELPVVSDAKCLRSNPVFTKITSRRTFCGGNRDGRGPCNGDSGGGFVVQSGGQWYLRGVISSALYDQELHSCDVNNYAVFTDVAQFTDWIADHVEHYG